MNRILNDVMEALWRRDVIGKTTNRSRVTGHIIILPFAKKSNNKVASES
jgi:hypothetical protein